MAGLTDLLGTKPGLEVERLIRFFAVFVEVARCVGLSISTEVTFPDVESRLGSFKALGC